MIRRLVLSTRRATERILPRGAILLSVLTFAGYAMGLVRDRIFARTFGAGTELDAYNAAFVLPELALDVLVAGGLAAPFVPIFLSVRHDSGGDDDQAAEAFGQTVLTLAVLVMALSAVFLFLLAPATVGVVAPGFDAQARQMYVDLFRLMCATPILFAASIALGEVLVADRRFLFYGLAPLMYNAGIVIGTLLFASRSGIFAAAIGALLGAVLHLAIRVVGIRRTSFRIRARLQMRTAAIREFLWLMLPKMLAHPIEPLVFLYFTSVATRFAAGGVSSISFARNFQSLPVSLIGVSIAIAAFPVLSAAEAAGDRAGFIRVLGRNLVTTAVVTSLAAIALFAVSTTLIRLLLGGGEFDANDVAVTGGLLAVFALSVPFESLTHLLARGFYATHDTIIPVLSSLAGLVVIVVMGENLAPTARLTAIPIAFTAGSMTKVTLLAIAIGPRVRRIGVSRPAL